VGMAVRKVLDTVGWDRVRIAVVGGVVHEDVTPDGTGCGGATWYSARLRYRMDPGSYLPVGVCSFGPCIDTELFCIYTNCFYTTIRYSNQQFACYNTVK
jgi:hypothetical protein